MFINREWAMPNSKTFQIKPIREKINSYLNKLPDNIVSIDPFANDCKIAKITNDLDGDFDCDYNLDALDFLKIFEDKSIDLIFFDPPYSTRQVSECYKKMGRTVTMESTQSSFWANLRDEITRIIKPNGIVMSFGWNSNGIGKVRGFEIIEILLVSHGGAHNDTIMTIEKKI